MRALPGPDAVFARVAEASAVLIVVAAVVVEASAFSASGGIPAVS